VGPQPGGTPVPLTPGQTQGSRPSPHPLPGEPLRPLRRTEPLAVQPRGAGRRLVAPRTQLPPPRDQPRLVRLRTGACPWPGAGRGAHRTTTPVQPHVPPLPRLVHGDDPPFPQPPSDPL